MEMMAGDYIRGGGKEKRGKRRGEREERSLHCASAKDADAPVGMTDLGGRGSRGNLAENKKAGLIAQDGLLILIPATTCVPTQLPVQYHRPSEA